MQISDEIVFARQALKNKKHMTALRFITPMLVNYNYLPKKHLKKIAEEVLGGKIHHKTFDRFYVNELLAGSAATAKSSVTDTPPVAIRGEESRFDEAPEKEMPRNSGPIEPEKDLSPEERPRKEEKPEGPVSKKEPSEDPVQSWLERNGYESVEQYMEAFVTDEEAHECAEMANMTPEIAKAILLRDPSALRDLREKKLKELREELGCEAR